MTQSKEKSKPNPRRKQAAIAAEELRINLGAVKLAPSYRTLWEDLEHRHGELKLAAALRDLRARHVGTTPAHLDLMRLAELSWLGHVGPVDPDEPDDDPCTLPWATADSRAPWLPLGVSQCRDVRGGGPGRIAVWLDTRRPTEAWAEGLELLRDRLGRKYAARADRFTKWAGTRGMQACLALVRGDHRKGRRRSMARLAEARAEGAALGVAGLKKLGHDASELRLIGEEFVEWVDGQFRAELTEIRADLFPEDRPEPSADGPRDPSQLADPDMAGLDSDLSDVPSHPRDRSRGRRGRRGRAEGG